MGRQIIYRTVGAAGFALATLLLAAPPAFCLDAPDGTHHWTIWRNGDKIGDYRLTFSHENGMLVVDGHTEMVRRLFAFPLARYEQVARERWSDDRLTSIQSGTVIDGNNRRELRAEATADGLSVEGTVGNFVLHGATSPSSLWRIELTHTTQLLDLDKGQVLAVHVVEGADEPIQLGDQQDARARHVSVSGDLARELWYGPDGLLLRMQYLDQDGAPIDFRAAP